MTWDPNLWTLPLLLGGVLSGFLGILSWRHRRNPALKALAFLLAASTLWILGYLLEILAEDPVLILCFARLQYLGIVSMGPSWLAFALAYSGRASLVTRRRILAAGVFGFITLVLVLTSEWQGLVWTSIQIRETPAGTVLLPSYGPWFWINISFQYLCLSLSFLILLWSFVRGASPFKGLGLALVAGATAPWLGNVVYISGGSLAPGVDLTVYGLAAGSVVVGWGMLAGTLIELVPVARERVLELSTDVILVIDERGWVVDANPAATLLMTGNAPLLGSKAKDSLAPFGFDPEELAPGRTLLELDLSDPPRTRIFDCMVSDLGEGRGEGKGRVLAMRDVTEAELHRRALEEGREVLEAQLRQSQKLETVGTLAGGIAHDFNNILAAIRGYVELALTDLPEGTPTHGDLKLVLQSTDRARDLVRQILTFSRKTPENKRPIQIQSVVEEAVGFLRASLSSRITLQTRFDAEDGVILADSTQIYQAITNLSSNAADAMSDTENGEMEIGLDNLAPEEGRLPPHLASHPRNRWVRLWVRDNGSGMDEDTRGRVYDPFFTTKEVGKGTGLGLAVVHGIVMSHGGWIDIASKVGHGTEITIWFPMADATGEELLEEEGPGHHEVLPLNVLVIDDEETIRKLCSRFLEVMGHSSKLAGDVQEGRQILGADPTWPDIILTDHTMPGESGSSFAETVRESGSRIPIVMMTGMGEAIEMDPREGGAIDALIAKPFGHRELGHALRAAVANRSGRTPAD